MNIHIITIVWGVHHAGLFLDLTLPNVLSPGNLPALARDHAVTYRFFTTPETRDLIAASPAGKRLAEICEIEYVMPLGDATPDVFWHVHWFHRSAAEGKVRGAAVMFVPPDTLWTDGALSRMGALLAAGKTGIACPFVLVASETCRDEARRRFFDADAQALTIPWDAMWSLAHRHIHPLHALAMPGAPHARPAFELHFPVRDTGMISRYAVRELVAFDPARCPISFLWYADGDQEAEGIHFATEPDEMLMLSVDPLSKYFQNYIVGHSCDGFDLARTTRHPLNDTPFTRLFATSSVSIGRPSASPKAWRRQEARAVAAGRDVLVARLAMLVYDALMRRGAGIMAGLLSVGLHDTHLVRRWRHDIPLSIVVAADSAFAEDDRALVTSSAAHGRSNELVEALRDHVVAGRLSEFRQGATLAGSRLALEPGGVPTINGAAILAGPIELEGIELYVVDRILATRKPTAAPPVAAAEPGWRGRIRTWFERRSVG